MLTAELFLKYRIIFNKYSFYSTTRSSSPRELYKYLIRQCQRLPDGPRKHYHYTIRQSFKQHVDETDPERIKQIIERSYEDAEWILKKYLPKEK